MKNLYSFLFIIIVLTSSTEAQISKEKFPVLYKPFFSIGYTNTSANIATEYYNVVLNAYRAEGVAIPTQVAFGKTTVLNGGIYFSRLNTIWIGVAIGYAFTPAYSDYRDYAGTLEIDGRIEDYMISIAGEATITNIFNIPLELFIQAGGSYSSAIIRQKLNFYDFPAGNYDKKWLGKTWGFMFQPSFGTKIQLGNFFISPQIGYRVIANNVPPELNKEIYIEYGKDLSKSLGNSEIIFLISSAIVF